MSLTKGCFGLPSSPSSKPKQKYTLRSRPWSNTGMNLALPGDLAQSYKSPAQQARVVTEAWGEENLFCPGCDSKHLTRSAPNREAIDYACPRCRVLFQLKSRS